MNNDDFGHLYTDYLLDEVEISCAYSYSKLSATDTGEAKKHGGPPLTMRRGRIPALSAAQEFLSRSSCFCLQISLGCFRTFNFVRC
jgi:hypothetical protein